MKVILGSRVKQWFGQQVLAGLRSRLARSGRIALVSLMAALAAPTWAEVELSINLSDESVQPGEQSLMVMLIANSGVAAETDLTVSLPFPEGLTSLSEALVEGPFDAANSCAELGGGTVCSSNESLLFDIPNLQVGQVIRLSLPITPESGASDITLAPSVLQNGSTLLTPQAVLAVDDARVLVLSIDEDQDPVAAGGTLQYTLRYGNTGDASVTSTNLAFELPANTSFVASSNGGGFVGGATGGVVSWNLGSLPAGAVGEQTVTVTVVAGASNGTLLPAAGTISGISASLPTEQGTTESAYVGGGSELAFSLVVNPDPAAPGDVVDVELIVTNPTNAVIFGGQLQLRYPQVVGSLSEALIDGPFVDAESCSEAGGGTVCTDNEFLNWDLGNVSPGQVTRITFPATVATNVNPGQLARWVALVRDDAAMDSTQSLTLPVTNTRALDLRIDEDADPALAGAQITYTLGYGNLSDSAVTATNLDFSLPPNASFVAASAGAVESNGVVSWDLGSLPSGSVGQQTVTVALDVAAADGALVDAMAALAGVSNSLPIVQRAREAAYVGAGSPLQLSVAITPNPVAPGDQVVLEMVVTNPTDGLVFGGTLRMRQPLGLASINEAIIEGPFDVDGSCAEAGGSTVCSTNEFLNWSLGNVSPGQAIRATLITTPSSNIDPGELFTVEVLLSDDTGALSTESVSVRVVAERGLALSIDEARDPVPAGENLAYSVRYGNFSDTSVTNSVLTVELPPNTVLISATGAPEQTGQQLTWELNSLVPTSIAEQVVIVAIDSEAADGTLLESAASLTGTVASLPVVQRAVEADYVGTGSDLAFTLAVSPDPALPGDALSTQMQITNPTDDLVLGGAVSLRYPRAINSLSEAVVLGPFDADASCADAGGSTVCSTGEFLVWNLGNVAPGQTIELSLPPTLGNGALEGDGVTWEPILTDDSGALVSLAQTLQVGEILPGGPLGSSILPLSRSVQVGQTATAFATLLNAGANPALDCTIAPVGSFPIDFSFQATDPATNASVGSVNTPVDIAGGGAQTFVFSITPNAVVAPVDIPLSFDCSNTDPAPIVSGLNALVFSAETAPIPDVIGLTTTVDLIAGENTPAAFAVGSANVGVTGDIEVSVDTGDLQLPIQLNLCLTDAQTGNCTSPIGPTASFNYAGLTTASIAVFVTTTGAITNNPAVNRVFIRFTDGNGIVRGATSTAVRTQ